MNSCFVSISKQNIKMNLWLVSISKRNFYLVILVFSLSKRIVDSQVKYFVPISKQKRLFYSPLRVIERLNKCFMQGRSIRNNKKKRIFVFSWTITKKRIDSFTKKRNVDITKQQQQQMAGRNWRSLAVLLLGNTLTSYLCQNFVTFAIRNFAKFREIKKLRYRYFDHPNSVTDIPVVADEQII
jgi:hypothetical protein